MYSYNYNVDRNASYMQIHPSIRRWEFCSSGMIVKNLYGWFASIRKLHLSIRKAYLNYTNEYRDVL